MNLANLKIGQRLGLGFGAVLVLLAALIGVGLNNMSSINATLVNVVEGNNVRLDAATDMRDAQRQLSLAIRDVILLTTPAEMAEVSKAADAAWHDYDAAAAVLGKMVDTERGRGLLSSIEAARQVAAPFIAQTRKFGLENNNEEGSKFLREKTLPAVQKWQATIGQMMDFQAERNDSDKLKAAAQYTSARNLLLGIGAAAMIAAVVIAWLATRSITRPMQEAVRIARTVAAGDLTSVIEVRSSDETGHLLQSLKEMNTSLQNIVGQVRTGTETIATASSEIATGNLDLSSRTEQQASALEETASSMEELTSTVKQNSENARLANELAQTASSVAGQGGVVVSQVVATMGSINESARKIVDIIGVIDGIAFQTNILALNAAVEAARAGEQGRGFAVVASEVRNLAQRSAAAAKEIKILINDSVTQVDSGSRLVHQAGGTMDEIVASVKRVTDIMAEITMAGREQESGIEQINTAVIEMDTVTQQNAALVEEAAAAAQSLQEQSSVLAQLVSVFKISASAGGAVVGGRSAGGSAGGSAVGRGSTAVRLAGKKKPAPAALPVRRAAPQKMASGVSADWEEF